MNQQVAETNKQRGIEYLIQSQQKDGSFEVVSNHSTQLDVPLTINLGIHALLLDILAGTHDQRLDTVRNQLVGYLLQMVSKEVSFNTVDTYTLFYALSVIYEHDTTALSPSLIAAAVRSLVDSEQTPGGPYYNALDSRTTAPDWLTNVSISRFIHHLGGPFPKLDDYITKTPKDYKRYYTQDWPLSFFNLSSAKPPSIDTAIAQLPDSSWPVLSIHKAPHSNGANLLYGSSSLTAAILVSHAEQKPASTTKPDYYAELATIAQADIATLHPLVRDILEVRLTKLINADTTYEIGPLAERLAISLHTTRAPKLHALQTLGLANLYNWVAYTIYDDFLDDEGDPQLLSAANVALRRATGLFREAVPTKSFARLIEQTFNTIDTANTWEITNCRFTRHNQSIEIGALPDYTDLHYLHDRSLSHGLPAIGTLLAAGIPMNTRAISALQAALKQYLIVRQLNDDLCDWKDDLQVGHISYVVSEVLRDAEIQPGTYSLTTLLSQLELVFWAKSLPSIGTIIQLHAKKARQHLTACTALDTENVILRLIDNLADVGSLMQAEQQQTLDFLHAFQT